MDFPGPKGGALPAVDLDLPPDADRVVKAMIDYLATRHDVDLESKDRPRGDQHGRLRRARAAKRREARGRGVREQQLSYGLGHDLFDYLPSIQERVRWIIGANDLADAT